MPATRLTMRMNFQKLLGWVSLWRVLHTHRLPWEHGQRPLPGLSAST